jgi:hypothetical protein
MAIGTVDLLSTLIMAQFSESLLLSNIHCCTNAVSASENKHFDDAIFPYTANELANKWMKM